MAELKPCRHCGSAALWVENRNMTGEVPQWVVTCMKCFNRSSPRSTKIKAIEEWNRGWHGEISVDLPEVQA
jgi:ribosomal protein L40E